MSACSSRRSVGSTAAGGSRAASRVGPRAACKAAVSARGPQGGRAGCSASGASTARSHAGCGAPGVGGAGALRRGHPRDGAVERAFSALDPTATGYIAADDVGRERPARGLGEGA